MHRAFTLTVACGLLSAAAVAQNETAPSASPTTVAETATASAPAPSATFPIQMTRPFAVGQLLHVRGKGSQERRLSARSDGTEQQIGTMSVTVSFDARAEVMQVDANRQPTEMRYTINECSMTDDDTKSVIAPKGSTLVARRLGPVTSFVLDGTPVGADATAALDIVASLAVTESTTQQIFGSAGPRSIGEAWSIDAVAAAKDFHAGNDPAPAESVDGTTTFVGTKNVGGEQCLLLHGEMNAHDVLPDLEQLPPDLELKESTLTAKFQGVFPENVELPVFANAAQVTVNAVLLGTMGAEGTAVEMHITSRRASELTTTPLDANAIATGAENAGAE